MKGQGASSSGAYRVYTCSLHGPGLYPELVTPRVGTLLLNENP